MTKTPTLTLNATSGSAEMRRCSPGVFGEPRVLLIVREGEQEACFALDADQQDAVARWLWLDIGVPTDDDAAQWDDEKPACAGCES